MPSFIITARRKELFRFDGDVFVVGAASHCALSLEDPLVAEEHCVLRPAGGEFSIADCGTSTGTFVRGLPTDGECALREGDEIVVGKSKLTVTKFVGDTELVLEVAERSFRYDAKRDPLEWSRTEVGFGNFPLLRWGNLAMLGVLGGLLVFCCVDRGRYWLIEPGPLVSSHTSDALIASGWTEHVDGCATCHEPLRGATSRRCTSCHEDLVDPNRHPFTTDPDTWDRSCASCHVDHRGIARGMVGQGIISRDASGSCDGECHSRLVELKKTLAPLEMRQVERLYNEFSHADHLAGEPPIPCEVCHVEAPVSVPATATTPRREFAPVLFESCVRCHGNDAQRDSALLEYAVPDSHTATWHGSDDPRRCTSCHQELRRPELRKSATIRGAVVAYAGTARPHEGEFQADRTCRTCHVETDFLAQQSAPRGFLHGTHLSRMSAGGGEEGTALADECLHCHEEQREAAQLVEGVYLGPPVTACARCHKDSQDRPLKLEPRILEPGSPAERNHFPHAPHVGVSPDDGDIPEGCLDCHRFEEDDLWGETVVTDESVLDCEGCHDSHDNVGGGGCFGCHAETNIYKGEVVKRPWPVGRGFRHFAGKHGELTREGKCGDCHSQGGTAGATTLSAVPIPQEDQAACRDCHLEEGARFHWR